MTYLNKKNILIFTAFLLFLKTNTSYAQALPFTIEKQDKKETLLVRLATFNIRSNYGSDKQDWNIRIASLDSLLTKYDFDIIGSQEPYKRQIVDLMNLKGKLYDYFVINTKASDDSETVHSNPIFYKKDRFKLIDNGVFWFSETPDTPASVSWEASQPRNCVWVKLCDKYTNRTFFVFNSHFDHKSAVARNHSAQILIDKVKAIAKDSLAICTGDFNTIQTTNAFAVLSQSNVLKDSHSIAEIKVNDDYKTNHGYKLMSPDPKAGRIDHIFLSIKSSPKTVKLWKCCIDNFGEKWASDHYPVYIEFNLE